MHRRRCRVGPVRAHRHGDGHWRLDGEDVVAALGAAPLAAEVQNPYLVADAAQVLPHAAEGVPVQVARSADEADDSGAAGLLLEDLPQRPAPEIDIQVVEVLDADAVPGALRRRQKVVEDWRRLAVLVAPAHPAAGAGLVERRGGLVAVVGRVAQADDDRHGALHRQRLAVLLGDGLQEQGRLRRLRMGAFQGVGQVDVGALGGQGGAAVAEGAADAQFAHGVGANQQFEAVEVSGQRGGLPGHGPGALAGFDAAQGVFDDAEQVGAGSHRRVQGEHLRVREPVRLAQPLGEQFIDQAHLRVDHLQGRVVGAGVLAQLRVVGGQEVLVKVQPRVLRPQEKAARHHGDDAQQQVQGSRHVGVRLGVRQHLQRPGQQAVLGGQGLLGACQRQRLRPLAAAQQQGEGDGLRVGVRELPVGCLREQQVPPVLRQRHQGGLRIPQGVRHVVAQHPAQGCQGRREVLEVDAAVAVLRQGRLPGQEVAQQAFHRQGVLFADGLRAVLGDVSGQAQKRADALAAAV